MKSVFRFTIAHRSKRVKNEIPYKTLKKNTRDPPEKTMQWSLFCALLGGVAGFIFLRKWWFVGFSLAGGAIYGQKRVKQVQKKRRAERQRADFRRFLEAFAPKLDGGSNVPEALRYAYAQLNSQETVNAHSFFLRIADLLEVEQSGLSLKEGMRELARRIDDWMIQSYWESFVIGMVQGSDLAALSNAYLRIVVEEEQLMKNREAKLDASQREQLILLTMPFILLAVMQMTGLVRSEYRLMDYVVRIVFAILYGIAWVWSKHILEESGLEASIVHESCST